MNSLTTVHPAPGPVQLSQVLQASGIIGVLMHVAPGSTSEGSPMDPKGSQVLFVIEGEVTVRRGEINTVLTKEQALLVTEGDPYSLAAANWAKLLRVDIPARTVVTPPLVQVQ